MKNLQFEYGLGLMNASLPDNTDVFIPGVTVPDPPCIPEEKLEIIFEKFFRLDSSRAQETGGSGLGLAIAREIARQHGGDITARSRDRRTCFAVRLPAWV